MHTTDLIQQAQQILQLPVVEVNLARPGTYQTMSGSTYDVVPHGDGSRVTRRGGLSSVVEPGQSRILDGMALLATVLVPGHEDVHCLVLIDPTGYARLGSSRLALGHAA